MGYTQRPQQTSEWVVFTVLNLQTRLVYLSTAVTGDSGQCNMDEKSSEDCKVKQGRTGMLRTALLLGGTGETGKQLLKQLAADPSYNKVISVGRRKIDLPAEPGMEKVSQEE